jgi:hypothetical protein
MGWIVPLTSVTFGPMSRGALLATGYATKWKIDRAPLNGYGTTGSNFLGTMAFFIRITGRGKWTTQARAIQLAIRIAIIGSMNTIHARHPTTLTNVKALHVHRRLYLRHLYFRPLDVSLQTNATRAFSLCVISSIRILFFSDSTPRDGTTSVEIEPSMASSLGFLTTHQMDVPVLSTVFVPAMPAVPLVPLQLSKSFLITWPVRLTKEAPLQTSNAADGGNQSADQYLLI